MIESKAVKENEINRIRSEKYELSKELETYKTENDLLTRKIMRIDKKEAEGNDGEVKA